MSGLGQNDLHKIFNTHVHDNIALLRHKSDMDTAKLTKLRELNCQETTFLKKYEKYTEGKGTRSRRMSVDINGRLLSAPANNYGSSLSVSAENVNKISLGRAAINSDFPYSYETWNIMCSTEKNIIEEYKRKIFQNNNQEDTVVTMAPKLVKRRTLKPIENDMQLAHEDAEADAEVHAIQSQGRQRTSSLSNGQWKSMPGRRFSIDASLKFPNTNIIPKIQQKRHSFYDVKSQLQSRLRNDNIGQSKGSSRRRSQFGSNASDEDSASDRNVKPVPNAVIFVQKDDGVCERININTGDDDVVTDLNGNVSDKTPSDIDGKQTGCSLPTIPQSPSILKCNNREDLRGSVSKSVTFLSDENENMRERSLSDCSSIASREKSTNNAPRRRASMSSTALKLMVDTHTGTAKLRYMAMLATEMEKELGVEQENSKTGEKVDDATEAEKLYGELKKCRYLRFRSYDAGGNDSSDLPNNQVA